MFSLTAHDEPLNVCGKAKNLVVSRFFRIFAPRNKDKGVKGVKEVTAALRSYRSSYALHSDGTKGC